MKIGVSTASLFLDLNTEDATSYLADNKVEVSEAFLTAFCEYDESFANLLNKNRKDMAFNSIHALTTQFEPQLYSKNPRALEGAYYVLEKVLKAGEIIGDHLAAGGTLEEIVEFCAEGLRRAGFFGAAA